MRELDLLQHIYQAGGNLPAAVTIGPGDDMGALRVGSGDVLVTVDQLIDGIHFDLSTTPLAKIGRKAITRNLSDVAAMGGQPAGAVVAVALPRDFGQDRAEALFDAIRQTGRAYGCPLFGGDIAIVNAPLGLTVTVLADAGGVEPIRRRGAQVGDVVCVTGQLGGSLATLDGYTHHLDFEPRLALGRKLAKGLPARPHCMIDLSDGLAQDLAHLCRASGLAAMVEAVDLPISEAAKATHTNTPEKYLPWQRAMGDGEDYELCFTLAADDAAKLAGHTLENVTITRVGQMIEPDGGPMVRVRLGDGSIQGVEGLGWEHRGT